MDTPEFDLFSRIENLEKIKPTINDTASLAKIDFVLGFAQEALNHPKTIRKHKDFVMGLLKAAGLSSQLLERLETTLVNMCEQAEKL